MMPTGQENHDMPSIDRLGSTPNKYKRLLTMLVQRYKNNYVTTASDLDLLGKLGVQMKEVKDQFDISRKDMKKLIVLLSNKVD